MAGYSKTPLYKKLGLKDGMRCVVVDAPSGYQDMLGPECPLVMRGTDIVGAQFVHGFFKSRKKLETLLTETRHSIDKDGMVWVSWPKKASKVETDITEGTIREVCLPMGFVDVKVCAVDDIWSGLKLVIRKELRG